MTISHAESRGVSCAIPASAAWQGAQAPLEPRSAACSAPGVLLLRQMWGSRKLTLMSTVFVGLSGGVDSAVSAALLKNGGHTVVGAFIKIWQPEFIECRWREDRLDAMRVAAALEIPFREIDLSDEYKRSVILETVQGYERGSTPNPDVLCNRHIKFGAFAAWAFSQGADVIATGHYARIEKEGGNLHLARGFDAAKDQSYFLWQVTSDMLARTMFPIGHLEKKAVRKIAEDYALPVAKKADSQGLCFVGDVTMSDFLSHYSAVTPGPVFDSWGNRIGEHHGAVLYTIGQRHGFFAPKARSGRPLYVIRIDVRSNSLVVSENAADAARTTCVLTDVNWQSTPTAGMPVSVQARYHEKPASARVFLTPEGAEISFEMPHVVSPGQSLVMYRGDGIVGGGILAG